MMKLLLAVGSLFLPVMQVSVLIERNAIALPGISTTSGLIFGHTAANRTDVIEYLGIPYAASTNGTQRWMPPQRFVSKRVLNAST
jgi:hypothetical protein